MMGSGGNGPYGPAMMGPGMMGPGRMGPGWNGPNAPAAPPNGYGWQNSYPGPGMGMMRTFVNPATVPAGPVSLRARNTGMMIHEVIVLPLGAGRSPGQLAIGANGQVDESASLAEAARSCGSDDGDGILPATTGWTTVTLPPAATNCSATSPGTTRRACTPNSKLSATTDHRRSRRCETGAGRPTTVQPARERYRL